MGKNGATIFDGDTFIDIESYEVDAVDSTGAGDMFAGAFLYGITNGHSYAEAGKLASLASSKVVSKYGPRLDMDQIKAVYDHLFEKINPIVGYFVSIVLNFALHFGKLRLKKICGSDS